MAVAHGTGQIQGFYVTFCDGTPSDDYGVTPQELDFMTVLTVTTTDDKPFTSVSGYESTDPETRGLFRLKWATALGSSPDYSGRPFNQVWPGTAFTVYTGQGLLGGQVQTYFGVISSLAFEYECSICTSDLVGAISGGSGLETSQVSAAQLVCGVTMAVELETGQIQGFYYTFCDDSNSGTFGTSLDPPPENNIILTVTTTGEMPFTSVSGYQSDESGTAGLYRLQFTNEQGSSPDYSSDDFDSTSPGTVFTVSTGKGVRGGQVQTLSGTLSAMTFKYECADPPTLAPSAGTV